MATLPKNKISISVSIPFDLLDKIDKFTHLNRITRSEFIVKAVKERLEKIKEQK